MSSRKHMILILIALVVSALFVFHTLKNKHNVSTLVDRNTDSISAVCYNDSSPSWNNYIASYHQEFGLNPIDSTPNVFRIFFENHHSRNIIFEINLKNNDSTIVMSYRQRTKKYSDSNPNYQQIKIGDLEKVISKGKLTGTIVHDTIFNSELTSEIKEKLSQYEIQNMQSLRNKDILGENLSRI